MLYQAVSAHLANEPRVRTPIRRCLMFLHALMCCIFINNLFRTLTPSPPPPPPPGAMCEKYQLKMLLFQLHKLRLRNDRILCIFTACKTLDSIFLEFYCSPCQMQLTLFINFNEPKCNMKNHLLYNLDIFQCAIV